MGKSFQQITLENRIFGWVGGEWWEGCSEKAETENRGGGGGDVLKSDGRHTEKKRMKMKMTMLIDLYADLTPILYWPIRDIYMIYITLYNT